MGKAADKPALRTVEGLGLSLIDEDSKNTNKDYAHQNRENHDHDPGLPVYEFLRIKVVVLKHSPQAATDLHVPVDIEKQREAESNNRKDKDGNGMEKPECSPH
jgi:hypothetical protein